MQSDMNAVTLALHGLSTRHCTLLTDFKIARETGYDAIEIVGSKLFRYLEQGYTVENLKPLLAETPALGLGFIRDIERQGAQEQAALFEETEKICAVAAKLGGPMVQLITGPHDPGSAYAPLEGIPWHEGRRLVAENLKGIGDIGRQYGIRFYLEALNFTPIHTLEHSLELIDLAERDNIGLVIDFWHLWGAGATPDQISKLDKRLIFCAHVSDSLERQGERGTAHQLGRNIWTGAGNIPLKEWVDAVRATGFEGWWASELLAPKYWELDPFTTARDLRTFFNYLFV